MPKATGRTGLSFERRLSTAPPPPRLARAAQLVQHVPAVDHVGLLLLVWVDATHKVRVGALERRSELLQLRQERDRLGGREVDDVALQLLARGGDIWLGYNDCAIST